MNDICQLCGAVKEFKPAGKNKATGIAFKAFMSCPNWKKHKENGEIEPRPVNQPVPTPIAPKTAVLPQEKASGGEFKVELMTKLDGIEHLLKAIAKHQGLAEEEIDNLTLPF